MSLIKRLLRALGYSQLPKLSFPVEEEWLESLQDISHQEQRSAEDVAIEMLEQGLLRRRGILSIDSMWDQLTPREKQVTALICLNYTNPQIAARLRVSIETVRTHINHIRRKFGVGSKSDLRRLLIDWDFTDWE